MWNVDYVEKATFPIQKQSTLLETSQHPPKIPDISLHTPGNSSALQDKGSVPTKEVLIGAATAGASLGEGGPFALAD